MKNNIIKLILVIIINSLINFSLYAAEQFEFDITEVEILENGNKFVGKKRGKITTYDGIIIEGDNFSYEKNKNLINIKGKVILRDTLKDYIIKTNYIVYYKNLEKIISKGATEIVAKSKYTFFSENVTFLRNDNKISSNNFSTIYDNNDNLYELKRFVYSIDSAILKGDDIKITTNYNKKNSDKFFFKNAFVDFDNNLFAGNQTEISLHKNVFDNEREKFINLENEKLNELFKDYYEENEPRLKGVSSSGNQNKTIINKGVFTSCKKNETCPAWSLSSKKITHDKIKKQIIYEDAILKIYDQPVFYFPKFFHPDPTVKRQSGFLRPQTNSSKILGKSIYLPYFHVISEDQDFTFKPTFFDSNIYTLQNEYRKKNKNSYFIADFAYTKGYQSSLLNSNKNSVGHLFANYDLDLKIKEYNADLEIFLEKTNKDTYLSIFENNLFNTPLKPSSYSRLHNGLKLNLEEENFYLSSGLSIYETLSGKNSDRYQYVLPYYNFQREIFNNNYASINFTSNGNNILQNTNNLRSRIINNVGISTYDYFTDFGLKNNFNIEIKNLNTVAKNDSIYKSTPQSNAMGIFDFQSSFPMIKFNTNEETKTYLEYLSPKLSFRASPNNLKNYASTSRTINTNNIFSLDRLGLGDSVEPGKSITLGLDYKKEDIDDIEKYFEFKLSTVYRDKYEDKIPTISSLNQKSSNIYGSIINNLYDFVKIDYNFSIDNNWKTFEYNSVTTEFSINNFITEFQYTKANDKMGSEDIIGNTTSIKFNDNNYFTFNTRRNREINLTEYYDLVYEYKNDCLTAGIKYKKTYYSNSDLKPNEDLLFTITLFPLTTIEQRVNNNLYR